MHGRGEVQSEEVKELLRQERAERVRSIKTTLQPLVRHSTKVAAKQQYLQLFPHSSAAAGHM